MVPFPLLSREDKKLITRTQWETKLDLGWVTIITTTQSISGLFLVFVCGPHEFFIESLAGVCPLSPKDCRTFFTAFFGVFHLTLEVFTLTALKSYRLLWGENWLCIWGRAWGENWLCVWGRACSNYVRPAMAHLVRVYWLRNCGFHIFQFTKELASLYKMYHHFIVLSTVISLFYFAHLKLCFLSFPYRLRISIYFEYQSFVRDIKWKYNISNFMLFFHSLYHSLW